MENRDDGIVFDMNRLIFGCFGFLAGGISLIVGVPVLAAKVILGAPIPDEIAFGTSVAPVALYGAGLIALSRLYREPPKTPRH